MSSEEIRITILLIRLHIRKTRLVTSKTILCLDCLKRRLLVLRYSSQVKLVHNKVNT